MRLKNIDLLKGFLPILIVFIHCDFLRGTPQYVSSLGGFVSFLDVFTASMLSVAVPAYFFISGFLFYNGASVDFATYSNKIRRRVGSLLLPYLTWNIIGLILLLIKKLPAFAHQFPQYDHFHLSALQLISGFWSIDVSPYPYDMPLWFIRNLIVVQLFAYPIGWMLKKNGILTIIAAAGVIVFLDWAAPGKDFYSVPQSFLFFILGGYSALHLPGLMQSQRRASLWAVAFVGLVVLSITHPQSALFYYSKTTVGIIAFCKIATLLANRDFTLPGLFNSSAFFIYAFHGLFITVIQKLIISALPPVSSPVAMADYLLIFVALYGISMGTYKILSLTFPSFTKFLTGAR